MAPSATGRDHPLAWILYCGGDLATLTAGLRDADAAASQAPPLKH